MGCVCVGGGGGQGARELTSSLHTCPLSPALCTGVFCTYSKTCHRRGVARKILIKEKVK